MLHSLLDWFKPKLRVDDHSVDPELARLYAENDAHLIFGVHVPRSVDALADTACCKSLLRHEHLNKRPKRTLG